MSISSLRIDPILDEPASLAPEDAGLGALVTARGNLPLHRLDVRADITGLTVGVRLTQAYRNPYDTSLEATYIFPLPDRAAVTGLTMTAGDRVIEGVLSERGAARKTYDAAIAAGQQASIAEEERPDVFTLRVGNILPGEEVTVAFTLAGPLPYADGQAEFRFPLVVAPRYIPGGALPGAQVGSGYSQDTDAVPDASRITPPVMLPGFPNPVDLSIEVRIDPAGLALSGIASSLHAITEEDGLVRIQPGERVNRDFILRLAYEEGANALVLVPDADGEEGTYQLTVLPPAANTESGTPRRPRDLVLLLDRSGSMGGWKMVTARRAAARIVDTLTPADRFAALTFDHVVGHPDRLPSGLVAATDRHRYRAIEHLARVDARGGTELAAPLAEALSLLADPSRDRILVLITDGQVGNEDQILRQITPGLAGIRVHTVGIDTAVNAGFLSRLAGVGGGRCELVESENRLDDAMDRIHRRIGAPSATGLRVEAEGLDLLPGSASPARIPDLFPGVPLVLAGRYRGAAAGTLTVSGLTPDELPWQVSVVAAVADRPEVSKIWARGRLRDLEDQYVVNGSDVLEHTIVETSLRHGVLCRFTAYVATDVRVVTDGKTPHKVTQLVELPAGWEPVEIADVLSSSVSPPSPARVPFRPQQAAASPDMAFGAAVGSAPAPAAQAAPAAPAGPGAPVEAMRKRSVVRPAAEGFSTASVGGGGRPPRSKQRRLKESEEFEGFGPELTAVIEQAAVEARRLRDGAAEPAGRRRDLLDDLLSRLDALLRDLTRHNSDQGVVQTLHVLVVYLRDAEAALEQRWTHALAVLDELAALGAGIVEDSEAEAESEQGPDSEPSPATGRRAFWKR